MNHFFYYITNIITDKNDIDRIWFKLYNDTYGPRYDIVRELWTDKMKSTGDITSLTITKDDNVVQNFKKMVDVVKPSLKDLQLSGCPPLKDDEIPYLLDSNTVLTSLKVSDVHLNIEKINDALKKNTTLNSLSFTDKSLRVMDFATIIRGIIINENNAITSLDFSNNETKDTYDTKIDHILRDSYILTSLNLSNTHLNNINLTKITDALKFNYALTTLNLSNNDINESGAEKIAEVLKENFRLTTLDLSNNKIGDNGAQKIAEALKDNQILTSLNLENNEIGPKGAKELIKALQTNKNITFLNISNNKIGRRLEEGIKKLAEKNMEKVSGHGN